MGKSGPDMLRRLGGARSSSAIRRLLPALLQGQARAAAGMKSSDFKASKRLFESDLRLFHAISGYLRGLLKPLRRLRGPGGERSVHVEEAEALAHLRHLVLLLQASDAQRAGARHAARHAHAQHQPRDSLRDYIILLSIYIYIYSFIILLL